MSKTKTKRVVASFLLLCAMSGTKAFAAMPDGWSEGDNLATFASGDTLTIDEATSLGNTIIPSRLDGAPLFIDNTTGSDLNVIFNGDVSVQNYINEAANGGAVSNNANLTFIGSTTFSGNEAAANGGAIYNDASGSVTINGGSFTDNSAGSQGGAVYNANKLTINGGTFENNYIEKTADAVDALGGAIYSKGEVVLDSTKGNILFENNSVKVGDETVKNDIYLAEGTTKNGSLVLQGTNDNYSITFNGSILGEEATTITSSANNLILKGDNSRYEGTFTQTGGKTSVYNKFFGGSKTHVIEGGTLAINASDAIEDSLISVTKNDTNSTVGTLELNTNTTLTGNVSGNGNITNTEKNNLTITGDNRGFTGAFSQTRGKLIIGDGKTETKSFAGSHNIVGGDGVTISKNATMSGTDNDFTQTAVNIDGTLEGTDNEFISSTVTVTGIMQGTNKLTNGTQVTVKDGGVLEGTNTITDSNIILNSGATLNGANTTLNSGLIEMTGAQLNGLSSMTGGRLTMTGGSITGVVAMSGGDSDLSGTEINNTVTVNTDHELTIGVDENGTATSFGESGSLAMAGGTANIKQDIELSTGDITGSTGTINMPELQGEEPGTMKGTDLTISGDLSDYSGDFNKTGGTITIGTESASAAGNDTENNFFTGNSSLDGVTVNMNNSSSLAAGTDKTITVKDTIINITNEGLTSYKEDDYGNVTLETNGNKTVIGDIKIADDATEQDISKIIVSGDNTVLEIAGDASEYTGIFSQTGGTTHVTDGSVFFGGDSTITKGNLVFDSGSALAQDSVVNIESANVNLSIDGSTNLEFHDGNEVTLGGGNFVLKEVTLKNQINNDTLTIYDSKRYFDENAGLGPQADHTLGKTPTETGEGGNADYIFLNNSVAEDGSKLTINDGSSVTVNANVMKDSNGNDSGFGADISGLGTVTTKNDIKDNALVFTSDNSGFGGEYSHNGGIIKFEGAAATNTANFFNGTNDIKSGSVIFAANSVVMGKNTVHSGANIELTDGSSIADGTEIALNDGGKLDITNATEDINLSIGVKGTAGAEINKTDAGNLIVSEDQKDFKGIFNHKAGNTIVNAGKSFFAGKNNISGGTVDLTQVDNTTGENIGAALAGDNTITDSGLIKIGDFTDTSAITDSIKVNTGADDTAHGLQLVTTDENHKNLEVGFAIEGTGRVTHIGEGTLNLNNAGDNDLFANYTGTFTHDATNTTGVTNVFGKSFANNDIQNGTLNMKNGSILVEGKTKLTGDGTLNIGNIDNEVIPEGEESKYAFDKDSKVTIASSISGDGKINISNGTTTLEATSNNSGFNGEYRQTGDSVVEAKADSTFFGGINNLIEKGKLLFRKDAKLAENSTVELSGNTAEPQNDTDRPVEKAVLDLDGRENAVFNGSNELTLAGESAEGAKFVFTDGILQNALLHGTQNIGSAADASKDEVITLGAGSGFASDAVVTINGVSEDRAPEVVLASGSVAADRSKAQIGENGILYLVSEGLDYYTITTGDGFIGVGKDPREEHAPNINIYNDQSGFKGDFYQDAGRVTVKEGATFFAGDSANDKNIVITGNLDNGTNGELYLEKGSFIGGDILHVNNAAEQEADQGAFSPHGRVYIADKIYTQDGIELTDINELMKGDLYYNTKYDENGNLLVDELKNIKINNAGLVLANGTVFDGSQGVTEFNKQNNGVVDIGFADGAGVNGDIRLGDETMLSYGDNAFIKDDSTLEMSDSAVLNFMNENTTLNYNPEIIGGGSIYKEGLAITNVSSAIDMTGELKVSEGTLNFTNKDKVIFNKGDSNPRQTGSATIGSDSSSANLSIVANQTVFGGDVIANAQNDTQSVLALAGKNTEIGGNLSTTNTAVSIFGNTTVGGNFNIDGNTSLNLAGNYANTIDVAGDLILGSELKDNKLPVSFDYDPHRDAMDSIIVDSFVNTSDSPLLITGINFVTSPVDRTFSLDADRFIQQRNPQDQPYYDPTNFYANTAMGRYLLSNGAGGPDFSGTLVHLNPQQYRGQVATIASWQNQLLINNLLFDHMDIVTRQLMDEEKTANKYAATIPQFAPYQYDLKGGSLWYKAYGNFETLSMTKGLNVGNNAYGALIGADFPLIKLKHGWNIVPTAYIGYNGAHQHFNGVSMYQNGAQLGVMGTAYKGDFITSLLAYGGGYGNDMSMRGEYGSGSDNTGNWFAGVASKTAYNFHLPADFIFQPTVMAAYNAFGSQNWGSDFGVMSMSSGMLNGINVAPGFNLIWQKKSFNIYLTAQMVYNIMGGVDGRAGNIELGYVRMRHSYFEYGLGVSKNFKDRFGGFLQFVIRNGGRTGIGFSGGIQIKLGK